MDFDFEDHLDQELARTPRELTNNLFHYTSSDAAILGILSTGSLRLSPFDSTNDLWESRPLYPPIQSQAESLEIGRGLWDEIDRHIRLHAKVTCLTQDWDVVVERPGSSAAYKGWAHLSLWAHYGGGHSGVCLRFDRAKLIQAFLDSEDETTLHQFHGPVMYRRATLGAGPYGIDFDQLKVFGVDAVAAEYAEAQKESLFFRKHSDWENESEYRFVLIDQSILPKYFDIRSALTGVFLGEAFPTSRMPALLEALHNYPQVEIFQLHFLNRVLNCYPYVPEALDEGGASWEAPIRSGSLRERWVALRDAEASARASADAAATRFSRHLGIVEEQIQKLAAEARLWPQSQVILGSTGPAIPEAHRARAPGVPSGSEDVVHWQAGSSCVVENLPLYSSTLVIAMAIQALDGGKLRVHAVITLQSHSQEGSPRVDLWRNCTTVPSEDALTAVSVMSRNLVDQVETAARAFDASRRL